MFEFDPDNLPEDMPEGMKAAVRTQADRHQMQVQAGFHDVNMFMESLTETQLRMVMHMAQSCDQSSQTAGYYIGRADAELKSRFDICSCGEKHNPEEELLHSGNIPEEPEAEPTLLAETTFMHPRMKKPFEMMHKADQSILLTEWDLGVDSDNHIRCTKCGMRYVSVEDRLMRDKDGCAGCHQMSGSGAPMGPRPGDSGW